MHHAIADGIALTRVLLSLTDGGEQYAGVAVDEPTADHPGLLGGLASFATHELVESATHPGHLVDLAAATRDDARALAKLLLLPPVGSYWGRHTGPDKLVTWSEPIELQRIKDIGRATGTTVNDVLLAALAGALRLDRERAGEVPGDLRVAVPFNLRPLDEPLPSGLGNAFGLVFLNLPVGRSAPGERLREMTERMRAIKRSAEGVVSYGVLDVVGRAPSLVEKGVVELFAAKAGAVMTNVAGPRAPVTLAGTRLAGTIGWVPMSGSIGVGVSIFSYAGEVIVGLSVDRLQVPDPHGLLEDVLRELDRLDEVASTAH
jgi:WS/DGAT/MGAT family acyltransferase